jgi:hypothetical protein
MFTTPIERAAWITATIGFLGTLLAAFIQRYRLPDLGLVVDPKDVDHNLKKIVRKVFPDSTLNRTILKRPDKFKGLYRADVRHVIFRQETLYQILSRVDDNVLFPLAKSIGESAAKDLFDKLNTLVRERKLSPGDIKLTNILSLLSYWDHTGGWGTYRLTNESNERRWTIQVNNDFLDIESKNSDEFWRGYFCGFSENCVSLLSENMRSVIKENDPLAPVLKADLSVKKVDCKRHSNYLLCIIQLDEIKAENEKQLQP